MLLQVEVSQEVVTQIATQVAQQIAQHPITAETSIGLTFNQMAVLIGAVIMGVGTVLGFYWKFRNELNLKVLELEKDIKNINENNKICRGVHDDKDIINAKHLDTFMQNNETQHREMMESIKETYQLIIEKNRLI